ncbi:MAG: CpsD/CapB family tyrosine-protein kinase [Paracoccaceae bacterium]|jgi:protein-tyrosine kinase
MEKLEAALEKARLARKNAQIGVEEIASGPRIVKSPTSEAWSNLPEVTITPQQARNARIAALLGGKDATPYDMLRSRTIRMMKESNWRRLAVTSPNAACGKTTVSLNLALSLARQKDLKVLLIDLDLRRPALHKVLGYRPAKSMHEVLAGNVPFGDVAVRCGENLIVAMNNSAARHPAELLHSEQSRVVLADIEAKWRPDVTIFDMSPMLASDDNVGFLGNVDCALLVAAAESTTLQNIDVCEKELAQLTHVLGVVLNKCRYNDTSAGYGYEAYE